MVGRQALGRRRVRPWSAPPAEPDAVDRPDLTAQAVARLAGARAGTVALVAAVDGVGGLGTTTLAQQVCAHRAVRRRFRGGCVWVTLGAAWTGSDLAQAVLGVYRELGGPADAVAGLTDPDRAGVALGRLLNRLSDVLLVVDDVRRADQLAPFLQGGAGSCARLVTTRSRAALPAGIDAVPVDRLDPAQARAVLAAGLPGLDPRLVEDLSRHTGGWALLVRLANLRLRRNAGEELRQAATRYGQRLADLGPAGPDLAEAGWRDRAVGASVAASLEHLRPDDQRRARELGIFAPGSAIAPHLRDRLWGADGQRLAAELCELGLATADGRGLRRPDPVRGGLRLPDAVRAALRTGDPAALRETGERFVQAVTALAPGGQWWLLPPAETYLWRHLCAHLADAGRIDELDRLVGDLRWTEAKLRLFGPATIDADLALSADPTAGALRRAIGQNAHLFGPLSPARSLSDVLLSRLESVEALEPVVRRYVVGLRPPPRLRLVGVPSDRRHPALLHTLTGHGGPVLACAVAPDSSYVLTAGADGVGRVFDAGTGAPRHVLLGHEGRLSSCAIAPDGSFALTTGVDGTARIWDPRTGATVHVLDPRAGPLAAGAIAPDASFVATAGHDGRTRIWDPTTGEARFVLGTSDAPGAACAVGPLGAVVATSRRDRGVELWDARAGRLRHVLFPHNAGGSWSQRDARPPTGLAFAADGTWLVTAGPDAVETWDVASGGRRSTVTAYRATGGPGPVSCAVSPDGGWLIAGGRSDPRTTSMPGYLGDGHHGPVLSCAVAPDGSWALSTSTDGTARLWDRAAGGPRRSALTGHTREVLAGAIAPCGDWVVTASADGTARIWDPRAAATDPAADRHASEVVACALPGPSHVLVTASNDGTAKVFHTQTGQLHRTLRGHTGAVLDCAVSADGTRVVTASADHTARLWTLPSGQIARVFNDAFRGDEEPDGSQVARLRDPRSHGGPVLGCAIAPDGSFVVTVSSDGTASHWDVAASMPTVLPIFGRGAPVLGCVISPDGSIFATFGEDGRARLWDAASRTALEVLDGHTATVRACAIAADNSAVVTASDDGTARLWDRTARGHAVLDHGSPVTDCAVAGYVVTAGRDGTARVWDRRTGRAGAVLSGHHGPVVSCDIAPDGRMVLTASADRTARLWDPVTGECVAALRVDGPLRQGRFSPDGRYVALVGEAGHYLFRYVDPTVAPGVDATVRVRRDGQSTSATA